MAKKIKAAELREIIDRTGGRIFGVSFIKRDKSLRKMSCRRGAKINLTGEGQPYDPEDYNLLTVFDMNRHGYRNIPLARVQRLSADGNEYEVEQ